MPLHAIEDANGVVLGHCRGCQADGVDCGSWPEEAALPSAQGNNQPAARGERVDPAVGGLLVRVDVDVSGGHHHSSGGRGGRTFGGRDLCRGSRDGGAQGVDLGPH